MDIVLNRPFMQTRASRGYVRQFPIQQQATGNMPIDPPVNYDLLNNMVRNDEIISAAFDTTVDMVTRNSYEVLPFNKSTSKAKGEAERAKKKLFQLKYETPRIQDNILYNMLYYGDCFLELRRNGGKVKELHVLETTEMRIVHDKHGEVKAYVQRPFQTAGMNKQEIARKERVEGVWFKPKDIVHYTLKLVGSQIYSQTPLEPIARIWSVKVQGHDYLSKLFMNLPPEIFVHLKNADKTQRDEYLSMLQRRKQLPGFIPVTYGSQESGIQVENSAFDGGDKILRVLEYAREAVLLITRVPPVWVGLVNREGANRGNSESQVFSFETRIKKIQQNINITNTVDLLPKLGFTESEFKHNPVSSKDEKVVVENASALFNMGLKREGLVRYLKRNCINDFEVKDFEKVDNKTQTGINMTADSRKGDNKRADDMTTKLDKDGVSEDGLKKIEEKKK